MVGTTWLSWLNNVVKRTMFSIDEATTVVGKGTGKSNIDRTSLFAIVIMVVQQIVIALMVEQCCNNIVHAC